MALRKIRLGDYIVRSTRNNHDMIYGMDLIAGVTSQGVFDTPKGNPLDVDLKPYKIVENGAFVYNPTRLNLGSIAYRTEGLCIVSHLYMVFYLNDEGEKIINPQWLYIYFRRDEFRREVTFRNFGSQRPEFNFNDMSEIEIPLPDIEIQQKYVNIYNAMVANQQCYERGLEDLRMSADAILDKVKKTAPMKPIGDYLHEIDVRNENGDIDDVQGINITKHFMPSVANTTGVNLKNYKVIKKGQLAFSGMQTGRDECIRIALFTREQPAVISPAYSVFEVRDKTILPEYIMKWFFRSEIDRRGWFLSDASIRTNLDLEGLFGIKIPMPDMKTQTSVVDLYSAYMERKAIGEKLKEQIKSICPILIKGSISETNV